MVAAGYKYNMTDIAAAIGRVQLKKAQVFLARRRGDRLGATWPPSTGLISSGSAARRRTHAWHLFIIRLARRSSLSGRDEFIEELAEAGHRRLGALHPAAHHELLRDGMG